MSTSDFFAETQSQFAESQQQLTSLWNGYQQHLLESQKKLVDSWTHSVPTDMTPANLSESAEKALSFQKELINTTLENQQAAVSLAIETQKHLWDSYFQITQKTVHTIPTAS
jgi:hypothetical protein